MATSADRSSVEELCQKLIGELHPYLEVQKSHLFLEEIISDSLHFVLDQPNVVASGGRARVEAPASFEAKVPANAGSETSECTAS